MVPRAMSRDPRRPSAVEAQIKLQATGEAIVGVERRVPGDVVVGGVEVDLGLGHPPEPAVAPADLDVSLDRDFASVVAPRTSARHLTTGWPTAASPETSKPLRLNS